jgi:hypothetical protein
MGIRGEQVAATNHVRWDLLNCSVAELVLCCTRHGENDKDTGKKYIG